MQHSGERAAAQDDTSPAAMRRYRERLRATPARERLERALRLSEQMRNATMSDIRRQNPHAAEAEIRTAFLRRVYGDAVSARFAARPK